MNLLLTQGSCICQLIPFFVVEIFLPSFPPVFLNPLYAQNFNACPSSLQSLPLLLSPSHLPSLAFSRRDFFRYTPLSDNQLHPIYSIDGHVHTSDHQPRPRKTSLIQIRKSAQKRQTDVVFITDHMSTQKAKEIRYRYLNQGPLPRLYPGSEEGSDHGHMGVWSFPVRKRLKVQRKFKHLMRRVQEINPLSLRILNHPGWKNIGARHYYTHNFIAYHPQGFLHAIEIMNGNPRLRFTSLDLLKRWNEFLSEGYRVSLVGGSDAHQAQRIGSVLTMVVADQPSEKYIINAVKQGRTYVTDGPRLLFTISPQYTASLPNVYQKSRQSYSFGETIPIFDLNTYLHLQAYLYTDQKGRWNVVHNGEIVYSSRVSPGCSSFNVVLSTKDFQGDGSFYITFTHKEFKALNRVSPKSHFVAQSNVEHSHPHPSEEMLFRPPVESKTHSFKKKKKKKKKKKTRNKGKEVDYLSLISSPIYYDLYPLRDFWKEREESD